MLKMRLKSHPLLSSQDNLASIFNPLNNISYLWNNSLSYLSDSIREYLTVNIYWNHVKNVLINNADIVMHRVHNIHNYFYTILNNNQNNTAFDFIQLLELNRNIYFHNINIIHNSILPIIGFFNNYSHLLVPIFLPIISAIINILLNNKKSIGILSFFSMIGRTSAISATSYNNSFIFNIIVSTFGWVAYIVSFTFYDVRYKALYTKNIKVFNNNTWRINKEYMYKWLPLHFLFYIVISLGVMFSTSFYFLISIHLNNGHKIIGATVASFVTSALFISRWYSLLKRDYTLGGLKQWGTSLDRCFQESLCFNALSLANFLVWNFWLDSTGTHQNVYAVIIGLNTYIILSILQMYLEIKGKNPLLYGLVYSVIFTSLSFSSTGLYALFIANGTLSVKITMLVITGLGLLSLPMVVYRPEHDVSLWDVLRGRSTELTLRDLGFDSIYQLILFYCFAIHTFIWLSFLPFNK